MGRTTKAKIAMLVGLASAQEEACRTALGDTAGFLWVRDVARARDLLPGLGAHLVVVQAGLGDVQRRLMAEAAAACDTRIVWIPDDASNVAIERIVQSAAASVQEREARPEPSSSRPPSPSSSTPPRPANPFAAFRTWELPSARSVAFVAVERKARTAPDAPLVLVVDDIADNREMYADYLRYSGLRVHTAATAHEALAKARREAPAVVVMDLALPGMDGWEAMRVMKEIAPFARIVVVTGHSMEDHQARAKEAGADAFYEKPLLPSELLRGVRAFLPGAEVPEKTTTRRRRLT
jgi:CheY-like chemotaxis protein